MSIQHDKDGEAVCISCGVKFVDHYGLQTTCMELHSVTAERDVAQAALHTVIKERDAKATLLSSILNEARQIRQIVIANGELKNSVTRITAERDAARAAHALAIDMRDAAKLLLNQITEGRNSAIEHLDASKAALAKMTQKRQCIGAAADWLTQYCLKDGGGHKRKISVEAVYDRLLTILTLSSVDTPNALDEWRAMEKVCEAVSKFIEFREYDDKLILIRGGLLLDVISASKGLDALRNAKDEVKA